MVRFDLDCYNCPVCGDILMMDIKGLHIERRMPKGAGMQIWGGRGE
jgi:hypothetical protein